MANYQHKRSAVAGKVPLATDLLDGEIAINIKDKKLFSKDDQGVVFEISGEGGGIASPVTSVAGRTGDVVVSATDVSPTTDRLWLSQAERLKLSGIEQGAQANTVNTVVGRTGDIVLDALDIDPTADRLWLSADERQKIETTEEDITNQNDYLKLKIFQAPTDGLVEIQTRTLTGGEVYEVRNESDGLLTTIYSDKGGVTEITQNGVNNVSNNIGEVEFFIPEGNYIISDGITSVAFYVGGNSYVSNIIKEVFKSAQYEVKPEDIQGNEITLPFAISFAQVTIDGRVINPSSYAINTGLSTITLTGYNLNGNEEILITYPLLDGDAQINNGTVVNLTDFKTTSNTWDAALDAAISVGWGVLFPKDGLVTFDSQVNISQADLTRRLFLNGCHVEFMADAIVDCDHFVIEGAGTIFLNTTVVTVNKGRLTFTENVKYLHVCRSIDFKGDLKIAQLAQDMVGPTNVMVLQPGHDFEVGRHVSSSWNNNKLPNSPSLVVSPNTGDENFLNRAESIVGDTITLSYDIVAYTIPSPAYVFQNTRFDRDFIRILGDGTYRFEDVTFNNSPSYMIGMRDVTQKARIFMTNVEGYNYAIDGFVMQCQTWVMDECKFGQQYDAAKSLAVVQMPKDGLLHWKGVDSRRGNGDGEIFVFGVQTFPNIKLEDCYLDGTNLQPFPIAVYNANPPQYGNAIGIYNCLHPFVTSSDGVVTEEYDGGSFNAESTKFINYQRAIFSTTYVQREKFSFTSCNINNCEMDCSPTYFNVANLAESSFGPVNVTNSKIKASTYSLNAIHDNVVTYENCEIYVDNADPAVVQNGSPVILENVILNNSTLRGWWTVRANSNVILRDVGLYPKEIGNDTTLSIQDPFFARKQNNFILLDWDATTTDSFIRISDYFGGNAIGSNFSPNSPFEVPFRIEGSNVDFETSNEFFSSGQAGVTSGNESYRANLFRERVEYPPLPTSGATSLYVPLNSLISSNIDNTDCLVSDRSRAVVTSGGLKGSNQVSIVLSRSEIDTKVIVGTYIGFYYQPFNIVYWYRITAATLTSPQNFDLAVDRFPIVGGTTGLFQDVTAGDEAYWFKTDLDNELPVGYGAKLTATGISGDEISSNFKNFFFTGVEYDDSNGDFYANPPLISVPNGFSRVDLSALVIYPSSSVESGGYYQVQLAQYNSDNTFSRLVADSGKCVAPVNSTDITINIAALGVNIDDGDYFIMRGRGTAFNTNPQPFTSAAVTIKKAK